jgi:phage baseplate assembly protein W
MGTEKAQSETESAARAEANRQYAYALAALAQPDWPADHAPADPYGRTLALEDGDLSLARDDEGARDLVSITGKLELAQGIQVLVGTPLGSDIFNQIFGFDLINTLAQPVALRQMRELVRLCVTKALAQEPRIRQIQVIAFADEPAYLTIHPGITPAQQLALAQQQKATRLWKLDILLDTRLGDQVTAGIEGVGL